MFIMLVYCGILGAIMAQEKPLKPCSQYSCSYYGECMTVAEICKLRMYYQLCDLMCNNANFNSDDIKIYPKNCVKSSTETVEFREVFKLINGWKTICPSEPLIKAEKPVYEFEVGSVNRRIFCIIYSPAQVYTVKWFKDNNELSANNSTIFVTENVITFKKISISNAGNYACIAFNEKRTGRSNIELLVYIPIEIKLNISTPDNQWTVDEGQKNITIDCIVIKGYPKPTITWTFNGKSIRENENIKLENDSIRIITMNKTYEGKYECNASSIRSMVKSEYLKLSKQNALIIGLGIGIPVLILIVLWLICWKCPKVRGCIQNVLCQSCIQNVLCQKLQKEKEELQKEEEELQKEEEEFLQAAVESNGAVMEMDPQMTTEMGAQLTTEMGAQLTTEMGAQLTTEMDPQMTTEMGAQLTTEMGAQLTTEMGAQLTTEMGAQLTKALLPKKDDTEDTPI